MSLDWIDEELTKLKAANLFRDSVARSGALGASIVVDDQRFFNFGSNDYLGIAADPTLQSVVQNTMQESGWGSGASPLILGRSSLHAQLEHQLAQFLDCEAVLLFPTGFAANAGTIPALVGKSDRIYSDAKNHASIIDGCRLSGAKTVVYPHSDLDSLRTRLQQDPRGGKRLIVSDGLFSMDGDVAHIGRLVQLADEFGAMLMIDEAHSLGVQGEWGGGVCDETGLRGRIPIRVGTLSKSFGSHGGFVAGSKNLIRFLANRARSYVFSTAAPVAGIAVALTALQTIQNEPSRRAHLLSMASRLRNGLADLGWRTSPEGTHIIPVVIGDAKTTYLLAKQLRRRGFWVPCIRPPSVPEGESLLRISLSSAHSQQMIDNLLSAFSALKDTQS